MALASFCPSGSLPLGWLSPLHSLSKWTVIKPNELLLVILELSGGQSNIYPSYNIIPVVRGLFQSVKYNIIV